VVIRGQIDDHLVLLAVDSGNARRSYVVVGQPESTVRQNPADAKVARHYDGSGAQEAKLK
jgi:hypothetical protein